MSTRDPVPDESPGVEINAIYPACRLISELKEVNRTKSMRKARQVIRHRLRPLELENFCLHSKPHPTGHTTAGISVHHETSASQSFKKKPGLLSSEASCLAGSELHLEILTLPELVQSDSLHKKEGRRMSKA